MNHANDTQALRYPVMATNDDGSSTGKVKQRITSAQEKLFILVSWRGWGCMLRSCMARKKYI
jgi:hypothetical protein